MRRLQLLVVFGPLCGVGEAAFGVPQVVKQFGPIASMRTWAVTSHARHRSMGRLADGCEICFAWINTEQLIVVRFGQVLIQTKPLVEGIKGFLHATKSPSLKDASPE
jgi:hypothetical protein